MKKIFYTSLLTFFFFLFTHQVSSFTNNFNVTADEELITVSGHPGKSYTVKLNLDTMNPTQTVYLFGLSIPNESSYSATSWISPQLTNTTINNQSTTTVSYTLTIPANTATGEYYQALAVGNKAFSDEESTSPTTFIAVPITIQVSPDASENISSNTTTTSSSSSQSTTSNQSTTQQANLEVEQSKKTTTKKTITPKTPPKDKPSLYSQIKIISFKSIYKPLNQTSFFEIKLKNDGNIYSNLSGSIQAQTLKGNVIKNTPLNFKKNILKPSQEISLTQDLKMPKHFLGFFKARLNLTATDSQTNTPQTAYQDIYFFHLGQTPFFLIVILLIIFPKNKSRKVKMVMAVILLVLLILAILSQKQTSKFLSETVSLNVTAELKEQIGFKTVINNDHTKTILFTNTNDKGSTLYSLQNGSRSSLDAVSQYTYGSYTVNLSPPADTRPLMMITTGY